MRTRSIVRRLASGPIVVVDERVSPDIKRLESELRTLWMAIQQDVADEKPNLPRPERRQLARSRFVQLVDDVVRDVAKD